MEDLLISFVESFGDNLMGWVLAAAGALWATHIVSKLKWESARNVLARVWEEIADAVREVHQTYVSEIKAGRKDGKLSDEEKEAALDKAISTAKANIGTKGLKRLMRILGLSEDSLDGWFATKVESAVSAVKVSEKALDPTMLVRSKK